MKSYKASCDKADYAAIRRLANGKYAVRWNPQEVTEGEGEDAKVKVVYEEAVVDGKPSYGDVVNLIVRQRYSESAEIALARQSWQDIGEYLEYNAYVEKCKAWAKEAVGGDYAPKYAPSQAEVVRGLRKLLSDVIDALSDEDAAAVAVLFEPWRPGTEAVLGERRYCAADGKLYRCVKAHATDAGHAPGADAECWSAIEQEE